jgi:hypothetical protein
MNDFREIVDCSQDLAKYESFEEKLNEEELVPQVKQTDTFSDLIGNSGLKQVTLNEI